MSEVTAAGGAGSPMTAEERGWKLAYKVFGHRFAECQEGEQTDVVDRVQPLIAAIRAAEADAAAREREECAKLADPGGPVLNDYDMERQVGLLGNTRRRIAAAIRARGTAP